MLKPDVDDLTIIYVLDPPGLTRDSIILLSSIRRSLGDVKVIAYVPEGKEEYLFPYVREFYDRMNAEIRMMPVSDKFDPVYKQGNKLMACLQPRDTAFTLFLDTDVIIAEPFATRDLISDGKVSIVPEGVQGWGGNPGSWEYVYKKFGLPFPEERVRLARSGKLSPPYYNAGMIGFPTGSDFAAKWYEVATTLDADPNVIHKRPWLDQISLPLAIRLGGLADNVVGSEWNLSISHPGKEYQVPEFVEKVDAVQARIVHFHRPQFFRQTRYHAIADAALTQYTSFESLDDFLAKSEERGARRDFVWKRFGKLKGLTNRTEAEQKELKELGQEKNFFKTLRTDLSLQQSIAPDSIVRKDSA